MNIICCIKQVPSTETKIRINPQTGLVDTSEVEWVINPYDEYALEMALRAKESLGKGTITAICLGPERVKMALRTALAMGVDETIQVWDPEFEGLDGLGTGYVLATAIKRLNFSLILTGKQAIDDDQAWVPQVIAHFLNLPHCAVVPDVLLEKVAQGEIICHREIEGGTEIVHTKLPCLITVQKGKFQPRYPTLKLMMVAKRKEIPTWNRTTLEVNPAGLSKRVICLGHRLPPPRQAGRILDGEPAQVVPELVKLLREQAKVI